ncbi:hypothetical protein GCM10023200_20110 [Actinomycetospora chlora]|uniref:Integral membrane protein n=1 Tax=Actinomycetospora chlora TaxID=663608 RepID=A0ABP9AUJ0_9PSEU
MTTPRPIRLAAAGVVLEGVVGVAAAVLLATAGVGFSVWGFVALAGIAVGAAGVALLAGVRGARGPCLVAQLLVLGCAFYAAVPSGQPAWGVPVMVVAALVLAGLLAAPSRAWASSG